MQRTSKNIVSKILCQSILFVGLGDEKRREILSSEFNRIKLNLTQAIISGQVLELWRYCKAHPEKKTQFSFSIGNGMASSNLHLTGVLVRAYTTLIAI